MNLKRLIALLLSVSLLGFVVVLLTHCARIAAPPGGPKDEDPPVVEKSEPLNYSSNFDGESMEIEFDEFINLRDINEQLIISPPLEKKPVTTVKGKKLIVELDEDLHENTTYTFNFGNAIVDNNESNPLTNFQFVFSTGDQIDSLSFKGNILMAFNLSIPEEVSILLYDNLSDSAVFKEKPLYVSKVNEEGYFEINNLKADTFQIFALQDENMNYTYEAPEMIAFSDSFLILDEKNYHQKLSLNDSTLSDSTLTDSLKSFIDTIPHSEIELKLFKEKNKEQYLIGSSRKRKEKLIFIFNIPLEEDPEIKLIDFPDEESWFLKEKYVIGDTLGLWLLDTALINQGALMISLYFAETNLKGEKIYFTDTIRLRAPKPKKVSKKKNLKALAPVKPVLGLKFSAGKGVPMNINGNFFITTDTPLERYDSSKIAFYYMKDSVEVRENYNIKLDTSSLNKLILKVKWKENTTYKIQFFPDAVFNTYGLSNDTIEVMFKVRELEYYGNIIMELEQVDSNLIIQLVEKEDKIVRQTYASNDTIISFNYLPPKTYWIKVIKDDNNNGKWDTGNVLEKIQPEKISYYFEEIKLRSNWDFKKNWIPEFKK